MPYLTDLYQAMDDTWPAVRLWRDGPVTFRAGQGGGSRVSAATIEGDLTPAQLTQAERAMADLGQPPLFMVREGQDVLDQQLTQVGYTMKDPVHIWSCPVDVLLFSDIPPLTTYCIWPSLAIQHRIWCAAGIGPARVAIMERACGPKTTILGRLGAVPAGVAYVAMSQKYAMLHALEVAPAQRRQGLARWMMVQAAFWARDHGATHLSLLCTHENVAANALYARMGMTRVAGYHYRLKS